MAGLCNPIQIFVTKDLCAPMGRFCLWAGNVIIFRCCLWGSHSAPIQAGMAVICCYSGSASRKN